MIKRASKNLPLEHDSSSFFLPWMVMLMVLFATLSASFSLSLNSVLGNLERSISGSLTVQITPEVGQAKNKFKQEVDAALEILRSTKGVKDAKPLTQNQLKELLRPWFGGNGAVIDDLPMPALIDVKIDTLSPPDLNALKEMLTKKSPRASLDVHYLWLSKLVGFSKNIKFLSFLIVLLVASSTAITVIYAASSSLDVHKDTIWLLHLIGAKDHYISKHFSLRVGLLSLVGGTIGLAIALTMIQLIGGVIENIEGGILEHASLGAVEYFILFMIPVGAVALTMLTSYATVWRRLKSML